MHEHKLQQLPAPEDESRVETGPVQFGDDWPGVFIRGDNAGWMALLLEELIKDYESNGGSLGLMFAPLRGLASLLQSCDVRTTCEAASDQPDSLVWCIFCNDALDGDREHALGYCVNCEDQSEEVIAERLAEWG